MRAAPWRIVLGVTFVLALAGATVFVVFRENSSTPPLPLAAEDTPLAPLAPVTTASQANPHPIDVETVDAARRALEAWGRFGVSGDLREVAPHFDERGPQYRKFESEGASLRRDPPGPPAYRFELDAPTVSGAGGERVVAGRVAVTRAGEDKQSFDWEIVLRAASSDTWRVWTVRERLPGSRTQTEISVDKRAPHALRSATTGGRMSGTAALNVWRAMRHELGGAVARELSLENDVTSTPAMRRMHIELRAFCSLARAA